MKLTQAQWIIEQLEKGRALSQLDMLSEYGIGNHTGRIAEIRQDLFNKKDKREVVTEWDHKNGKTFARYRFAKLEQLNLV